MRKISYGVVITLVVLFSYQYWQQGVSAQKAVLKEGELIQQQIINVGKLIVTEGHFSEVFNYKDSKAIFGTYFTATKKALVVVNAEVNISYDLSKLKYKIDTERKIVELIHIPKEELKVYPDFEYYDVSQDYFNAFNATDYNAIKKKVKVSLLKKINVSSLKKNAKNRLISELSKFYILTSNLGWELKYKDSVVVDKNIFLKD